MDRRYAIASLILFIVLSALAVWYVRHTDIALLDPAGPIALLEQRVILLTLLLSGVVVIPVFAMLFTFAWRFHAENPQAIVHHAPNWDHDSVIAEVIWWLIPSLIIVVLSILAWQSSHALDPYKPLPGDPVEVEVVALNWKWLFLYPDQGVATVNQLEIPVGRPVHFKLTADSPMNSFWIPQLGGQIMVMPGMSTQLYLQADRVGEYRGLSGNISGEGFAGMTFTVHAVTPDEFNAWVVSAGSAQPLDQTAFEALAATSTYEREAVYSLFSTALYNQVVSKYMMPMTEMSEPMSDMPAHDMPMDDGMDGMTMPGMQMPMQESTTSTTTSP